MQTKLSLIFNPETVGGLLIRLYMAASLVAALSILSLILGGIGR
jgi:hypothetical protein